MKLNPALSRAHFRLSRMQTYRDNDETQQTIAMLQELLALPDKNRRDRVEYNFALAKIFNDIRRYDQAWQHYDTANRLKPGHSDVGSNRTALRGQHLQDLVEKTTATLTTTFFEQRQAYGRLSQRPVFVIGMPRSGTTLVEQILSRHPAVFGAGELKEIGMLKDRIVMGGSGASLPEAMRELKPAVCHNLAESYLQQLEELSPTAERVIDKMPTNFLYVGLIALLFPKARFIHCLRDPRDILLSCYFQNLDAPFCDLAQLVRYYNCYRRLINHWQNVLPGRIETIQYEQLVTDVEQHARRMTEHCGLPWNNRCLDFQNNKRSVRTPSKVQVRQPVYQSSVARWKYFEKYLLPHIEELDFPRAYAP